MGLFGGGNSASSTTNQAYTYNTDNRIGVGGGDGDAVLLQEGASFSVANSSVVNNEIVDPGVLAAATNVVGINAGLARDVVDAFAENNNRQIAATQDAVRRSLDNAADTTAALERGTSDALRVNQSITNRAFDANIDVTRGALDATRAANDRSLTFAGTTLNFVEDVFSRSVDAISGNARDIGADSKKFVLDFTNQLADTTHTENERQFDKIAQLVTVVAVVAGIAFLFRARA